MTLLTTEGQGLPQGLVARLRADFRLDWQGVHGGSHWARVMHHGLHLASVTEADPLVVRLFAVFHDSQRRDEDEDPGHGARAASLVRKLHSEGGLGLDETRALWLIQACEGHSGGGIAVNPTIAACWDADRLDLGRVGIRPDPRYLCTSAAADHAYIEFAWNWSRAGNVALAMRPEHGLGDTVLNPRDICPRLL